MLTLELNCVEIFNDLISIAAAPRVLNEIRLHGFIEQVQVMQLSQSTCQLGGND